MKVTCQPKEGRRFVITICVDDEPWKDVNTKIFGRDFSLPACETQEALQERLQALEYAKAKKYAIDCLAKRSYPTTQLRKLLEKNLVSVETIQALLKEFVRLGYLNDEEWIERFVKAQINKHQGPQAILYKLMNKGISTKEAEKWIEKLCNSRESNNSLQHLLRTKYKNRNLSDYKERQKVFASLARKGFDIEDIKSVLEN